MVHNIVIHDIRSSHNVGAILRSSEGFGVKNIYIGGTSPYPRLLNDSRLPHIIDKQSAQIAKTALGAENILKIQHYDNVVGLLEKLRKSSAIIGLEQADRSTLINHFYTDKPITLIIGNELSGISPVLQNLCDDLVEIPMIGKKESFNVSVATGIALYALSISQE